MRNLFQDTKFHRGVVIVLFVMTLMGCKRSVEKEPEDRSASSVLVTFYLNPTKPRPGTYAINSSNEATVNTLFAMVFDENDRYMYGNWGTETVPGSGVFQVRIYSSTVKRTILLLANTPVNESLLTPGLLIDGAIPTLEYTLTNTLTEVPMWGKYVFNTIAASGVNATVAMMRSVARADVLVNVDNPLAPTLSTPIPSFTLVGAQVYRQVLNGRAIPNQNLVTFDDPQQPTQMVVTAPSMPTTPLVGDENNPYPATVVPYSPADFGIVGGLYMNENLAKDNFTSTCIIVEGQYLGVQCWYRINFGTPQAGGGFIYRELLRNHRYIINITDVLGLGHPSVIDALNHAPSNIEYTIIDWNTAFDHIVFDGTNYFYSQSRVINVGRDALTETTNAVLSTIPVDQWTLSFEDAHNGPTITNPNSIENNRFRVDYSATVLTVTSLKGYDTLDPPSETHQDVLIIRAKNLELRITLIQRSSMPSDWINGGGQIEDLQPFI